MSKSQRSGVPHDILNRTYFWRKCTFTKMGAVHEGRFLMAHSSIENRSVLGYVEVVTGQVVELEFDEIRFIK